MSARETDTKIKQLAQRLRLTYLRDHLDEVLEGVIETKMTPRDALAFALGKEVEQREANHFRQALMAAHLPAVKRLEDFDLSAQPSIDPGVFHELARLEWLQAGENVALFGPPGVGKTHIAIGLGRKAIEAGHSVRFYSAGVLFSLLEKASREDQLEAKMREVNRPQLLIVDEVGYLPYSPAVAHLFFQLVSRRYEKKSLVITSNRPPSEWQLIFADKMAASAILDHLLHHCTALTITGESYRLREHRKDAVRKGTMKQDPGKIVG